MNRGKQVLIRVLSFMGSTWRTWDFSFCYMCPQSLSTLQWEDSLFTIRAHERYWNSYLCFNHVHVDKISPHRLLHLLLNLFCCASFKGLLEELFEMNLQVNNPSLRHVAFATSPLGLFKPDRLSKCLSRSPVVTLLLLCWLAACCGSALLMCAFSYSFSISAWWIDDAFSISALTLSSVSGLRPDTFLNYLQLHLVCVETRTNIYKIFFPSNCSYVFDYLIVTGCTLKCSYKSSTVLGWTVTLSALQLISHCETALFCIMLIAINAGFNINDTPNFRAGLPLLGY